VEREKEAQKEKEVQREKEAQREREAQRGVQPSYFPLTASSSSSSSIHVPILKTTCEISFFVEKFVSIDTKISRIQVYYI
jgi:hypothetical protein